MNAIVNRKDGLIWFDVSTRKYPNTLAVIDEADEALVLDGGPKWSATHLPNSNTLYVSRATRETPRIKLLHRFLLDLDDPEVFGEHKNHDGLDNTRENIRIASRTQNQQNMSSHKDSTSKYVGVSWDKSRRRWVSAIYFGGKQHLKRFHTELAAAIYRDEMAKHHFGEFANLNFPEARAA